MESEPSKSFWVQHAHLGLGVIVVLMATTVLSALQIRSANIRHETEAAVFVAEDLRLAMAEGAPPVALTALHQKLLGAIENSNPSPRVEAIHAELESLGMLAAGGETRTQVAYSNALRDVSQAMRHDAVEGVIRVQQTQTGVIAGAAIILILLIRDVASKRESTPRPRRAHPAPPVEIDPLTGLGPVDAVRERLGELLDESDPGPGFVGLLIVGLQPEHERFLPLTRAQLDATLAETSRRLRASLRATDVLARMARDELAVVMPPSPRLEDPGRVAGKLLRALEGPLEMDGAVVRPNPRVGVAVAPVDAVTPDGLIQRARLARRSAGSAPTAAYRTYGDEPEPGSLELGRVVEDLASALEADDGQLWIAYQPKIDLLNEKVDGFEALARWDHPRLGSVPPATFVRAAEQSDLIFTLGAWVLDRVCAQLAAWSAGLDQLVPVSVNMSGRQFEHTGLADLVRDTLEKHRVPAELLELELTEAILVDDRSDLSDTMDQLSNLGVRIAIDDFSTGYSVLAHLKRFPIDVLKIDRSFIREMDDHRLEGATSNEIIEMAHSMSLRVVAEGVETPEQLAVLRKLGCDAAQGYYFAHPASPAEIDRRAVE